MTVYTDLLHWALIQSPVSYTHLDVYKRQVLNETEDGSLLEVSLKTGRHHQIRVQLAHAGLPIFGDAKYNPKCTKEDASQGISLCAYKLSFLHPAKGKKMEFQVMPVGNFPIV